MNLKETSFQKFTNLYELSKTLRFELKPEGVTLDTLKLDGVIQEDREIEDGYNEIKKLLDDLHILFVEKSLANVDLSLLEEFYNSYIEFKKDTKNKENIAKYEKSTKNIRKELVSFFEYEGDSWLKKYNFLKKWWTWFLTEKEVLELLKVLNPEKIEIIENFDGFYTYFSNFNESRKNFYADDWRSWAISTRAIDENLITFIENIGKFNSFYKENQTWVDENFEESEKKIFELDFYNSCLLQSWIDDYNQVLWAKAIWVWENSIWINQKINLYKQQKNHNNSKDKKFPKFDLLYKQILSKIDKKDFIISIENKEELFDILQKSKNISLEKVKIFEKIFKKFFDENNKYNLENIYISKVWVNTISNKFFESRDTFKWYLWESKKGFISFLDIQKSLEGIIENDIFKEKYYKEKIAFINKSNYENFLSIFKYEFFLSVSEIHNSLWDFEKLQLKDFSKDEKQVELIKNFLDSILTFYSIIKYFNVVKNRKILDEYEKDGNFYNDYDNNFIDFEIWKDYNLVRNYLSKKEVETDKFKLNFDNSQFLTGWDKDKEKERFWLILRKDWKYFLWILKKWFHNLLSGYKYQGEESYYEKMEYKQLNNVYRQLPRLAFSESKRKVYWITSELEEIKKEFDIFQKNKERWEKFDQEKLKKLIDCYKKWFLATYWNDYDLEKIKGTDYTDLNTFYSDIEEKTYKLNFVKISSNFIDEQIRKWNFYLFQIYNKDFSKTKKEWSKENIHTKYFKLLFDEKNLENLKIKLSWWAEIFFRDQTKNLKQRKDKNWGKIFYTNKKTWNKEEVLENRRYAEDKILFHLSITLNANTWDMYKFNSFINENYINKNKDIRIIWIDRWEKHLAYYSVIDKNWKVIETDTLNEINWVNYLELLEKKQKSRADWRLSWWEIESIKELKNGYISQVVNKLAELIIKHNAIIVFEDLNSWFKRWRQKIEKQIYQKLELALAKKLNYLTFKDKQDNEIWWYLNWIQLVGKVTDYADIWNYKQSWIMFYTNPAYTSTTCPHCGWRKTLKFPTKLTKQSIFDFFKGIKISFNWGKFSFTYFYWDEKTNETLKKEFTVSSNVKRTWFDSKKMENIEIDINKNLLELFKDFNLNSNINKQIQEKTLDSKFLNSLMFNFKLINQIRNSDSKQDKDIISCPSCSYNSEKWFDWFDFNGDANGAYNIARKGIIILENVKNNPERPNLLIKDNDWDVFLGKKEITLLDIING